MKKILKYFFLSAATFLFVDTIFSSFTRNLQVLQSVMLLACNLYCLYKVRKNYCLLLIFMLLLYFNYSMVTVNFFTHYTASDFVPNNADVRYVVKSLNILWAFNYLLIFAIPKRIIPSWGINLCDIRLKYSAATKTILFLFLLYILMFQFVKPDISGERGSGTPLYEYSVIVAIVAALSADTKKWRFLFVTVFCLFSLQELAYGGRVTALQYLLLIYIVFFAGHYDLHKIMPVAFIGFIIFTFVGMMRGEVLSSDFQISYIIDKLKGEMFSLDTAYSAYYTSMMFIRLSDVLPTDERLQLFYDFILSVFRGESANRSAVLPVFVYKYYWHCFGGVLPHYFYFYLGGAGLLIPIIVLRKYFDYVNGIYSFKSKLLVVVGLYITVTLPRWYLYSPINLFRGVGFVVILYFMLYLFNNKILRR